MIVSHEKEYVYCAIPRTASRATAEWLEKYQDGICPRHIKPRFGTRSHHRLDVPDEYSKYRRFAVIREPVQRMESYFRSSGIGEANDEESYNKAFLEYLKKMVNRRSGMDPTYWQGSQFCWIATCGITDLVCYDDIPHVLDQLWFTDEGDHRTMPVVGRTTSPRWPISEECVDFLRKAVPEDFGLYDGVSRCLA